MQYRLKKFYENADILHHDCCEFSDEGWIEVNLINEIKKTVVSKRSMPPSNNSCINASRA